jgi:hypothetical protein
MPSIKFEFDPEFDDNVYRASNKQGSSLRGLYDKVRAVTDEIARSAKRSIEGEWTRAESEALALRDERTHGDQKNDWLYAKARSFALRTAASSTFPTMGYDGKEIYGMVSINRRGSAMVEFGGPDPVAEIGRDTGKYVEHPPYSFLRRAMDRAGD